MIFHKHHPRQQQLSTLCVVCIAKMFVQEDEFYFKLKTVVRSVSKASSKRKGRNVKVYVIYMQNVYNFFSIFKWHKNAQMFYFLGRWQIEKNVSPKCFLLNVKRRTWKVEKKIILKEKKNDGKNDII